MINSSFDIVLQIEEKKEKLKVVIQEINKARLADMTMECAADNGKIKIGMFLEKAVEHGIIVSPKNILDRLEEADNGLELYAEVFNEINSFCNNPKKYKLLSKKDSVKASK